MCVNNWFKIVCCSSFSCLTRMDKNAFGGSCEWQEFMIACCASWTLGLWQLESRAACDAYCKTVVFGKRSGLHVALVFNFFQLIMASNYSQRETHRRVKALTIWNEQILLSLRTAALFRFCLRAGAALHRPVTCCSCSFALGNLSLSNAHIDQKLCLFPFNTPWLFNIFIAKCLYSCRHDLPENFGKTTAQECQESTSGWCASLENVFASASY